MTPILLCLHGWGGSKESFTELRAALEGEDITIFTPDLPGFGAEPEPKEPWSVDDYADWVAQWLTKQSEIRNQKSEILLLGHSHGGRIAIKLASRQSTRNQKPETRNLRIDHLYLCAAAGIPRASLKRMMGFILAKMGKAASLIPLVKSFEPRARTLLYTLLREHDYERASPVMRRTLAKVVAEDLTPLLSAIRVPTDLFWGADDTMTPLQDGKLMHKHIAGSVLHIFEGVRHRVHRDRAMEIASVISSHL
ncbi:MAG: alpha/beta fold hydrolase [Candidatus Peribacteraceae bacterium]|nr:alpha/beta fold hydrolase [Candidatus Peribacteraceae bacterium]